MTTDKVARALKTLHDVLTEVGWAPRGGETGTTYRIDLGPPHVPIDDVVVAIDPEAQCFVFFANFHRRVPSNRRDKVARMIMRANWDLLLGGFEMNDGDGSVRFRYAIDFKGCELPAESIRRAILTAMEGVEAHADALMTAMTARTNTLEATVRISRTPEGGSHGTH